MGISEAIDLDSRHRRTVISLLDRFVRDTQVWAYGSRVAWTSHPASDLDLVVFASSDQTSEVLRLREAFDDSNIPFRVDVHIWDRLPSSFHEEIITNYVILQDSSTIESSRRRHTNSQLGEFAPFSYGKSLPASKRNSAGSVPVFGANGIIGWHDSAVTSGPTVIIGRKGTVGAVHYSPSPCWPIDTTFYIDGSEFDLVRFKYYLLKSMHLEEMNADSAVPGLNRDDAHSLRIAVPDEATQRKIARTLGALDDRIELNRRMCETLEAMAQALFKSWFVDFDPIRAKTKGRDTGLPDHIADLFPDRLGDSPLGPIPKGWGVSLLHDVAVHGRELIRPMESPDALYDHYSLPAYDRGRMPVEEPGGAIGSNKYRVAADSVLVSRLNPYTPRVWLPEVSDSDRAICSTEFMVLRPRSNVSRNYLYLVAGSNRFLTDLNALVTGTSKSHQRAPIDATMLLPVLVPAPEVLRQFNDVIKVIMTRIAGLRRAGADLARMRDILLPLLLGGQLRPAFH